MFFNFYNLVEWFTDAFVELMMIIVNQNLLVAPFLKILWYDLHTSLHSTEILEIVTL